MAVDAKAGLLYAVVSKEIKQGRHNSFRSDDHTVSNVAIYDISDITGGKNAESRSVGTAISETENPDGTGSFKSDKSIARIESSSNKANESSNDLSPQVTFKLAASIPDLILSSDRQFVYFLNASDGEIRRLDTTTLKIDDTAISTGPGRSGCEARRMEKRSTPPPLLKDIHAIKVGESAKSSLSRPSNSRQPTISRSLSIRSTWCRITTTSCSFCQSVIRYTFNWSTSINKPSSASQRSSGLLARWN